MRSSTAATMPAAAAKVLVTGASVTSILAMTAAMGVAAPDVTDEPLDMETANETALVGGAPILQDRATASWTRPPHELPVTPPVIGQVGDPLVTASSQPETAPTEAPNLGAPTTATAAPPVSAAPVPATAPAPVIVQIPAPAPLPDASTSKSR